MKEKNFISIETTRIDQSIYCHSARNEKFLFTHHKDHCICGNLWKSVFAQNVITVQFGVQ